MTWTKRIRLLGIMVVFGCFVGLIVDWLGGPQSGVRLWLQGEASAFPVSLNRSPWDAFFYGVLYSVTLWSAFLWARRQAYRLLPLRSWRSALVHVALVTVATSLAFAVVYLIEPTLCDLLGIDDDPGKEPSFAIVFGASATATLVISLVTYGLDLYMQLRAAEEAMLKAELKALRAQVNPHFLFNTLNSIAALVHQRPDDAEAMTERLADLFRYTLRASDRPEVTLGEDLQATESYIDIESVRFRERMVVLIDVPTRLHAARVPSLLLQPLVENAVKYGVARSEDACAIRVEARESGGRLHLHVRDTGPGFDSTDLDVVATRGTGLGNVRDRLHLLFGPAAQVTLLPDGVALAFPFEPLNASVSRPAGAPVSPSLPFPPKVV